MRLENEHYLIDVASTNGAISRISDKVGDVELITESRIADSFLLLTLTADMRQDRISAKDQSLCSYEQIDTRLLLRWDGPLTGEVEVSYEMSVEMEIAFVDSRIEFRLHVDNRTLRTAPEVWYPMVGGISGIGEPASRRSTLGSAGNVFDWYRASPIDSTKDETISEVKLNYSFNERASPQSRDIGTTWVDTYNLNTRRALYIASHDVVVRNQTLMFEK